MLKLAAAVMLAAVPTATAFPLPDFANYNPNVHLIDHLAVCAADMDRMAAGLEGSIVDEVARSLPPAQANRLYDVCTSFFLGAHYVGVLQRRATQARPLVAI